ncbi:putative C6 finger domain-containing protein [Fusarium globosum]|uniref:Putative C6 finger domain-containing protein n=1 Tax=Fusarium globosum TaxID=78864 RepID=A0A8H5Z0H0_9HYPO|nr:putative C6 finger domain-containing protein [Fusarium globosum]
MSANRVEHMNPKKPARRSRYGCRNCKLRKLKCDESKPRCKKCSSFGVLCNFGLNIPDLHPITPEAVRAVVRCKPSPQRPVASAVWTSDEYTIYQLNAKCQDFVTRYYARSLLTPDDGNMIDVNRRLFKLAFTNPCLMHASLAVALTYDRYLNTSLSSPRSLEECYHWSQSTALFNKKLRQPVKTQDKDPIWGTAAALAVLTFSSPDAYRTEDSWPLKTGDDDLDWVSMISGKMSLWNMVDPLRNDSLFRVMAVTIAQMQAPLPEIGIRGIPEQLVSVCRLNETSTPENPYFYAAHAVSRILYLPDSQVTTGQTQLFTHRIDGAFKELLLARDPVALLLLYIWYRKAGRSIWWVELRARVECPAICLYLQRYHADEVAVHALLQSAITIG